jgi:1,4-dihydroxy-2-naphthoate octaprenyltransferase
VILGDQLARAVAIGCMVLQYVLTAALVIAGFFTPVMLVVALALPTFAFTLRMFQQPKPAERPEWFPATLGLLGWLRSPSCTTGPSACSSCSG